MLRVATAFSGGLAACEFALKYEDLEHEVVFACEWDKYARKQYIEFHGEPKTFYNDVSDLQAQKYKGQIDLFVWGSPCQDLSLAGKRKGFDGEKSSLFRQGARVMNEMMPKTFIFENVKGLLSSNNGNDYKEVIKTFQDLGYLIAMKVVNTKEHGIPQNRERVFIVGFLDEPDYHNFRFAEPEPLKLVLRDMLDDNVDEKYYLSNKMIDSFMKHRERHKDRANGFTFDPKDGSEIAVCISTKAGNRNTDNYIKENQLNASYKSQANTIHDTEKEMPTLCAGTHGYAQGYIKEPQLEQIGNIDTKGHNSLWSRVYSPDGLGACLNANGGGAGAKTGLYHVKSATTKGYEVATEQASINFTHPDSKTRRGRVEKESQIYQTRRGYNSGGLKNTCPTITSNSWEHNNYLIDNYRIRRLTPKECFKLQGVKSEDIQLVNSYTQSYKIAGNAISVNVMQMLLQQLYKAEKPKDTLF